MTMDWNHINAALYSVSRLLDVEQGQLLYETARSLDEGARILEIGAWKGYSTCCLAFGCLGRGGLVYTIDAFCGNPFGTNDLNGPYSFDEFWHNIEMLQLEQYVKPLIGKSEEFYKTWTEPIDLLFIDGNHDIMDQDYAAFYPHLKEGGWLFMHDLYPPGGPAEFCQGMKYQHNLGYRRKGNNDYPRCQIDQM